MHNTTGFVSYIATHTLIFGHELILGQSFFNILCDMTVVMAGLLCSYHSVVALILKSILTCYLETIQVHSLDI